MSSKSYHPIGLFTGEERSLPREFCVKISLDNIAPLQVQLEALQMQKISSSLFKANKFLPPDAAQTWNFLLGTGGTPLDSSAIDCMPEELADQDLESSTQPLEGEDSEPSVRNRKVLRSGQVYLNIPTTPRPSPRSIPAHSSLVFACDWDPETKNRLVTAGSHGSQYDTSDQQIAVGSFI